jgi:hypothetical protein
MKKLVFTRPKLRKRDIVSMYTLLVLGLFVVLSITSIVLLRRSAQKLNADNEALSGKVASLQGDLREIGESLSGKTKSTDQVELATGQTEVPILNRIGLIATPGETAISVDTLAGWELVGENRLRKGGATVAVQSEDIDLLKIPNYQVSRIVESFTLRSGLTAFLVFIKTTEDNKGYLSVSFCNPDIGAACSFKGKDGKFVFILAHGYKEQDQFVRDMDFNTVEGIKLLGDFKVMLGSMEIS